MKGIHIYLLVGGYVPLALENSCRIEVLTIHHRDAQIAFYF